MKKSLLISVLLLLCAMVSQAQQKVIIKLTDGTTIEKFVWELSEITFADAGAVLRSEAPAADEAVDLGLSVKWSPKNLVATTTYEGQAYTFTHFGWGDVTGFNQTDSLRYFPVLHPTVNITGDENRDIAKKLWGDEWRLPNEKEVQELLSCTWTWDAENGGYTVTGTNGNSIFIEADGQRELKDIKDQTLIGYYWTGVFNKEDDTQAFALRFDNVDKTLEAVRRSLGLAIRPVFGKPKLEVSTTAQMLDYRDEYVSVDSTRAKFQFVYTLEGNIEQAGDYGLLWGEKGASLEIGGSGSHQVKASGTLSEGDNSWTYTLTGLTAGKKYEVRTFLMIDGSPKYGDVFAFSTAERFPEPRYVDMGTSVRWAEWNMGAQEAADFGLYFGWGDVAGDMTSTNPYDYAKGFNAADKTIAGNTKYDVAALRWGGKWRMPTEAELLELAENSTWTREERHSATGERISGYLVTSKISGNSIFLPAGGYYEGTQSDRVNSYALYWCGDFDTSEGLPVYYRMNASPIRKTNVKYMRTLIRPVYVLATDPANYNGGEGGGTDPDDPDTPVDPSDPDTPEVRPSAGIAVDLGLSVKWANYNIGATCETDAGYYIAWGDTIPRESYSTSTYIHYNASTSSYVDLDNPFNKSEYTLDAARHQWGGSWRVPTQEEMSELWLECTWTWKENYKSSGVNGFLIVSNKNKNSIFLPACGYMSGSPATLKSGSSGRYWTSSHETRREGYSLNLMFTSSTSQSDVQANPMPGQYQYHGLNIRPVCSK